jgi:hypothetical protein
MHKFILSCSLFFLFGSFIFAKDDAFESDFWAPKMIQIDPAVLPTLEFICLENDPLRRFDCNQTNGAFSIESIIDINFDLNSPANPESIYLSRVSSESINQWLVRKYIKNIEFNVLVKPFLIEELEELALLNQQLAEMNTTAPVRLVKPRDILGTKGMSSSEEGGFTKFALYLIIGGGFCIIYSVLAPSGTSSAKGGKTGKIELARRKRWLVKVFEKGWIDRPTYQFLLKRIETLPEWLGGLKPPPDQSEDMSEDSVALSNLKRGESVVKTKDTSEDKTSR